MTQITIPVQVVNGQLHHDITLSEMDGKTVLATLTVVSKDTTNRNGVVEQPQLAESPDFDPEVPSWLEVENDVYFPITRSAKKLGKKKIRRERGKPCIILPEELPDD